MDKISRAQVFRQKSESIFMIDIYSKLLIFVCSLTLVSACTKKASDANADDSVGGPTSSSNETNETSISNLSLSLDVNAFVAEGETLSLVANIEGFDAEQLTYQWSQVSGVRVKISNADKRLASIEVPPIHTNHTVSLRLVVALGAEEVGSSQVEVVLQSNQAYGYKSRPCGFDFDDDGIFGEAEDCRVCNSSIVDIDGDGTNEDQLFVDSTIGNDTTGDGSPGAPFLTIQKALDTADGPGDNVQDIICIAGTFNGLSTIKSSGTAEVVTRNTFEYPVKPILITAWDKDGDGEYPPYDTDDTAVLDGQSVATTAISGNSPGNSHIELAHLRIVGYTNGIVLDFDDSSTNHVFIHDLELDGNNQGLNDSNSVTLLQFNTGAQTILENNHLNNFGSFAVRTRGHYVNLFHNSLKAAGGDGLAMVYFWDSSYSRVSYNHLDGDGGSWSPTGDLLAFDVHFGSVDVKLHHNLVTNSHTAFFVSNFTGASRNTDDIEIYQNRFSNDASLGSRDVRFVYITAGIDSMMIEDVTIRDNIAEATGAGWIDQCLRVGGGSINTGVPVGVVTFVGNTCHLNSTGTEDAIFIQDLVIDRQDFVIKNNIFQDPGDRNIWVEYTPTNFVEDGNVFDPAHGYHWNGASPNLTTLKTLTASPTSVSKECVTTFESVASGNFELATADTCARGAGVDISSITAADFIGRTRQTSTPAAGALETP